MTAEAAARDTQLTVHLGGVLRRLRKKHGWSIEEAARRAGISRNTLGGLEVSPLPNPNLSTLLALMEIYEVRSIEELFGGSVDRILEQIPSKIILSAWVTDGRPGLRDS